MHVRDRMYLIVVTQKGESEQVGNMRMMLLAHPKNPEEESIFGMPTIASSLRVRWAYIPYYLLMKSQQLRILCHYSNYVYVSYIQLIAALSSGIAPSSTYAYLHVQACIHTGQKKIAILSCSFVPQNLSFLLGTLRPTCHRQFKPQQWSQSERFVGLGHIDLRRYG
jgi:hypothetical protein